MKDRLENLRLFFPAEVTGAYFAIQSLLTANGVHATEFMWHMVGVTVALAAVNAVIYWKVHGTRGAWLLFLTFGFVVWVLNIDLKRFKDLPVLGQSIDIEIVAPALLIFYTLITSYFEVPRGKSNAQSV